MMAGAIAFFIYASCTSRVLMGQKFSALKITSLFIAIWFISAFGLWFVWLR